MTDNYPIDFVVPLVFPNDPVWFKSYRESRAYNGNAEQDVRFRTWETEELLMECVKKFMPWLNKIHILVSGESQVQKWMKGYHIVYHKDFMPEHLLPTFNVCTIEMFLHKIPDLAEHFIYSNDDFFPLSPLTREDFFRNGLPCQHNDERPYPNPPNIFHRFVMKGLNMVARDFGKKYTNTWLRGGHSMQPMLKSTVEKVCALHKKEIEESFAPVRDPRNLNQYIFPFYQHLSGKYVDYLPRRQYIGLKHNIQQLVDAIRDPNAGIVCINDHEDIKDWKERANIAKLEIAHKLSR